MSHRREDSSAGYRHARLEQLLLEELRALIRDEATDPTLEPVRLLGVKLSVDYRHAKIHFTIVKTEGATADLRGPVERALARATPFLRARLADAIELKRLPDLRFVFSTSETAVDELGPSGG